MRRTLTAVLAALALIAPALAAETDQPCQWWHWKPDGRALFFCVHHDSSFLTTMPPLDAATLAAADAGDPHAMLLRGRAALLRGKAAEGAQWIEKAAATGDLVALTEFAQLHESDVMPLDTKKQRALLAKAMARFYAPAAYYLGLTYAITGYPDDARIANTYFYRAAGQGDPAAQVDLGWRLNQGIGARKDSAEAVHWLVLAAEGNDARARSGAALNLARIYNTGDGVPVDKVLGKKWGDIAITLVWPVLNPQTAPRNYPSPPADE